MNLFRCFAISFALSFAAACSSGPGTDFKVASPDGTLCVGIRAADSLTYTVTRHGTPVLLPSAIGLHFADGTVLGRGAKVTDARRETVERVVEAPFYRQARFTEHYNQLRLTFEGGYAVTFRVFDQGCAYRIETHLPGERTVAGEVAEFNFAGDPGLFAAYSDGLCNAYQSQYEKCRLSALGTEKPVLLPLAADCGAAGRVLVCEADLEAYPGMFLTPSAGGLRGLFAAAHRLVLDIHGVYKPTGQNRTYPNIVNFESVFGLEELKWSNPDMPLYDVTFPFIRMVQGPVDYTPGAYRNATREGFRIDYRNPMSQGTRAHQVAAYVVFDAPLVMLCDSPTRYMADEACTRFIASLPVVFDTTRVLAGEIGEYIVTARKRQDCWYVGGLTGWTPRTLDVDLSLLDPGREYTATLLADDDRSAAEPARYVLSTQRVTSATRLQIPVAPGGGFALKIEPADNK